MEDKKKLLAELNSQMEELKKQMKNLKAELKQSTANEFKKALFEEYGFSDPVKRAVSLLANSKLSFEIPSQRWGHKIGGSELEKFLDQDGRREEFFDTYRKTAELVANFIKEDA